MTVRKPRVLELDIPAEPQRLREVRRRLADFLGADDVAGEDLEALTIALTEACSNAVSHGSPRGTWNRVRLRFELQDRRLSIEVTDEGHGFTPGRVRLPATEEWKASGRGLYLIHALVDEVHYEPTPFGTRVHLIKHLGSGRTDARSGEGPAALVN